MKKTFSKLIILILLIVVFIYYPRAQKKNFVIDEQSYQFIEYKKSLEGIFLLTPRNAGKDQAEGRLLVLDSMGEKRYFNKIKTQTKNMTYDFKLNRSGQYSYFLIETNTDSWGQRDLATVSYHLLDQGFKPIESLVIPPASNELDLHDVFVNRKGNTIFIYYNLTKDKKLIEAEFREVTPQGKTVFSWKTDQFFKNEKKEAKEPDYLHANSVFEDADGGLVLSFNQISTILKINYPRGDIAWVFSRKEWTFFNDDQKGFSFQHTPIILSDGHILMYDNAGLGANDVSRAVEYELDFTQKKATLVWQQKAEKPFTLRSSWGNAQRLSNGNTLISWGSLEAEWQNEYYSQIPIFTEYNREHEKVRELLSLSGQVTYKTQFQENTSP